MPTKRSVELSPVELAARLRLSAARLAAALDVLEWLTAEAPR